ncbi:hypothetical protein [Pseudomonas sp. PAGU 2196]|uniref:hypothetical protein n=1 Tax=Pseudomonas sp. PAGU 2196 TaxID=2793997 RepID=UPI001EDD627A|nr:hypothetical protein [Pseudomonas sp. PAGU 2196]
MKSNLLNFPGPMSRAMAQVSADDLGTVAPLGGAYSLLGSQCQYLPPAPVDPRCRYYGPRVGMAGYLMTDEELLIAAAMAEKAAGVTAH